jgi:sugar/nucleoside kinase (ribokinase family)
VRFDYVTVGHVTVDVLEDASAGADRRQPGGGAFYSALQAARLGLRAQILTRGVAGELEALLEPYRAELEVAIAPAEHTTTLETWDRGHARTQRVRAWAGRCEEPTALDTAILHFAPIARETPRSWQGRADLVGLTPQGLVRAWDERGDVARVALEAEQLPQRCDAIVFSAGERESCAELIPGSTPGAVVAVTAGPLATTILQAGRAPLAVRPPTIAAPRDDLGAGDVFAAAFFVALREGLEPAAAAAYGNAAAAVRIAGAGPAAIGDRAAIEARL